MLATWGDVSIAATFQQNALCRAACVAAAHLIRCSVSQFHRFFSPKFVSVSPAVGSRAPKSCSCEGLAQMLWAQANCAQTDTQ